MKTILVSCLGAMLATTLMSFNAKADQISQAINEGLGQATVLEKQLALIINEANQAGGAQIEKVEALRKFESHAIFAEEVEEVNIDVSVPIGSTGMDLKIPSLEEKSIELVRYEIQQTNL